ncbi:leucine-rich repeat-containing protein 45-like [Acanthaster planci]|uniref:Leucine-rich repeat-containing protein 45-like n=1 Tax=Acanthaster planci TaxID=133434 RepID=A0A8B7YGE3_ACAPL|nr:leucine-rich repeat-containing protein 45-like [Acanthaster planci]XP_022091463.1 leucine-rich repeat-containing protein 45-like [Acanthaster planci]XP_022091464.1 leucine-rich repeat-containing protein 45-like [Acanthaster planci]XP_022091465.1 leucine-rich repeat-containing protein 45-like [Acanthaster planci]
MEDFRTSYLRLCKENSLEPQQSVLSRLSHTKQGQTAVGKSPRGTPSAKVAQGSHGAVLDLSTTSLTVQTCSVLGAALAKDCLVGELRLSDCMIGDEGFKLLGHGLCSNIAIRNLDLKGNNLRGASAEALGNLLQQNHSLRRLCLEWNSLGLDSDRFAFLAEGLAANNSLEMLDLRNNQLSHDGVSELSKALHRNCVLRSLDLRWNNIGIVGGRSILAMLQYNKTVTELELAGNNITQDILKAIDVARQHNVDRASLTNEHETRQSILAREIKQLRTEKKQQASDLLHRIDQQNEFQSRTHRDTAYKIHQLQEALAERKSAFNALNAKLSKTEAELVLAEQRSRDLSDLLEVSRRENSVLVAGHQKEMQIQLGDKASSESKLLHEIASLKDRNLHLETKADELDKRGQHQQDQIYELKEELATSHAQTKLQATQAEERLQNEKQRLRDQQRDLEHRHTTEMQHQREAAEESERAYRDRISKLEEHRRILEEEMSKAKNQQLTERLALEEQILSTRQRVKEEEHQRMKHLEDKIRLLANAKDDIQQHHSQQLQTIAELQAKNSNAALEVESLKRRLEEINQELAGKNNELQTEVNKVKLSCSKQLSKMEARVQDAESLRERCSALELQLAEQTRRHRTELMDRDNELEGTKEKMRSQEMDFCRMQEEEAQRAGMLQAAISGYLTTSRTPLSTPRK